MASIPWTTSTTHLALTPKACTFSPPALPKFNTKFVSGRRSIRLRWAGSSSGIGPSNGSRTKCWFKFGKNGVDAEGAGIYGSQSRDDFDRDDVEQVLFLLFYLSFSHC